jgi:uncharacterized protein YndB with AHSA1/START domain
VIEANRVIRERRYPRHIDDVWRAMTTQAERAQWFMSSDFETGGGCGILLDERPAFGVIDGDVLEVDAPRLLRCRWVINGTPTKLTILLRSDGADTVVRVEHEVPPAWAANECVRLSYR